MLGQFRDRKEAHITRTGAGPEPLTTPGRFEVLRHRDFSLLFAGQAVSVLGDRLVMVAMPFAVLSIPGAGLAGVGLVLGASALSLALFVLVGGVVADRLPRHLMMLGSDVVRAAAQMLSAALLLSGTATVWRLVALQAVYGAAEAFFRPAVLGLVPQVVASGEEQSANALLALTSNVGMVLGPALAGVLVAVLGPGGALVVDAGTFAVSALTLVALRPRPAPPSVAAPFLGQLSGGWREVRTRSWVWTTLLAFSAYHALVLPAVFVLGPKVAGDIRDGSTSWGWISSGFGVGAVVGSVVALHWRPRRPGLLIGTTLSLASTQAVVCASALPTWSVAALEAMTGVCVSLCFTVWETALQERIPAEAQSRVSSFDHLASMTLMPVGFVLVGPVAQQVGTGTTAVGASLLTGAICLAVASSPGLRSLTALALPSRSKSED
ncbi:MAG: transporter [Frankiales bacterium]|nr:transporter [Frankiales bacterium]